MQIITICGILLLDMSNNGKNWGEKSRAEKLISPGLRMLDTMPESIRKLTLQRTTIVVPVEGERQRTVKFAVLPKDVLLRGTEESVRVDFPVKKNPALEQDEIKAGIVQPSPREDADPTLVVLQQDGQEKENVSFMDGQRYTTEPEIEIASEFVRNHLDHFPPASLFEEN